MPGARSQSGARCPPPRALADRAGYVRLLLAPGVLGIHGAAGKHPHARHEARVRASPHQQDLQATIPMLAATAQQDQRGGRSRFRDHALDPIPVVLPQPWPSPPAPEVTSRPMSTETQTAQLWICTSCGFVYDPDEGDPDGGIPPGTPFESIPDDWFCPVCGARKADFEPYEE